MISDDESFRGLAVVPFADAEAWACWLDDNHGSSAGIWMRLAKKASGVPSITYAEAVDMALCYGWIDGQKQSYSDVAWLQKFTPRGPKSIWSKINCAKAEHLIATGAMKPAGLAAVNLAKGDGRWDAAYDSQSNATVPDDLQAALDQNPEAKAVFATLKSSNRYAILFRIHHAKKAETRAARIAQYVAMLADHQVIDLF